MDCDLDSNLGGCGTYSEPKIGPINSVVVNVQSNRTAVLVLQQIALDLPVQTDWLPIERLYYIVLIAQHSVFCLPPGRFSAICYMGSTELRGESLKKKNFCVGALDNLSYFILSMKFTVGLRNELTTEF